MEQAKQEVTPDQRTEWLAGLTVGDYVGINTGPHWTPRIAKIDEATATQVVADGSKYRRSDGMQRGKSMRPRRLVPVDDVKDAVERDRIISKIALSVERKKLNLLSTDQLRRIDAILSE